MATPDLRQRIVEIIDIMSHQMPFDDLHVETHHPVGDLEDADKAVLRDLLKEQFTQDPSHLVTGIYTLDNIDSRPDNCYVIIGQVEVILNVAKTQMIVMGSAPTAIAQQFVKELLIQLPEVFIFASGEKIVALLTTLDYDRLSNNIVYQFNQVNLELLEHNTQVYDFVRLDHSENYDTDLLAAYGLAIWDYPRHEVQNLDIPHVVVVNDEGQPIGGARANAVTEDMAVVGGVITIPAYRQQGVGTAVSQVITAVLVEMGKEVVLETDDENIPAIKIYEKLGYERVGKSIFLDLGTDMITKIRGERQY